MDGIVTLVIHSPNEIVGGQRLYVDMPRSELQFVRRLRLALRGSLKAHGRRSYKSVDPRPDHRGDGNLIQIADMFAGELSEQHGRRGPYLGSFGDRCILV